ncbi:hypothetical protein ACIRD3_01005 [Kitasatospora sp. NPDC093550]|uniref:hypothetical protein n=1 Tax=Kitasatospora sp. NPDC093550 TaxID=3364089 RepID=UPI0038108476
MNLSLKRWRIAAVAMLTALSVLFLSNSSAFATQVGEGPVWNEEIENNVAVQTAGGMVEARDPDNGVLLQTWRGYDNAIYLSVNHGRVIAMPRATTYANPAVVWRWSNGDNATFRVFHTGTNGFVFYTDVSTTGPNHLANIQPWWNQVPNGTATPNNFPVTVAALPNNSIFLAFRGSSSNEIWSQFFNGTSSQWSNPTRVTDARSDSAPALSFSRATNITVLAWRGTDSQMNLIRQSWGENWWWGHDVLPGVAADGQPAVAMADGANGQLATRRLGSHQISLTSIFSTGGWQGYWDAENTGRVVSAISLVAYATTVYLLAAQYNGVVSWKPSRQF